MTIRIYPERARPAIATEAEIQRAVFGHWRCRAVPAAFAFHPANGGWRSPIEAAILKGLGLAPGVPDFIAVHRGHTFALELKTPNGKLSERQETTQAAMRAAGASVATAHGLDAALDQLERWKLLRGGS
jgi:hypothetical protein